MSNALPLNFNLLNMFQSNTQFDDMIDPFDDATKKIIGTAIPYINASGGKNLINPSTIGLDTFQKMYEKDDVIPLCLDYHLATLIESIGEYEHENEKIQEHNRYIINNLEKGFNDLVSKIFTATHAGFGIQEMYVDYDEYLGAHCVKDTFLLPPLTILFQADNDGRMSRTYQYVINATVPAYSNLLSENIVGNGEVDPLSSRGNYSIPIRTMTINPVGLVQIEKDDIIHYTHAGLTGLENPYGVSVLNHVYGLYLLKWGLMQAMATAFQRRAVPYTIVYANSQQELALKNRNNEIIWKGNPVEAAQNTWANPNATDIFIMPGKKGEMYEVDVVDSTGNLGEFTNAINAINNQIMRALKVPDAIFGSPSGSSYALGSSQGSVFRTFSDAERDRLCQCLLRTFIKKNIELSFDISEYNGDLGKFATRVMNIEDQLKYSKLFGEIKEKIGVFNMEMDANRIRDIFGFDPLDDAQIKELEKKQQEQQDQQNKGMNQKEIDKATNKPYASVSRESRTA